MTQEFGNIHADLRQLRRAIAANYPNAGGARAAEYLKEAEDLVVAAYDVLRRENRKKAAPRDLGTVH